MQRHVLTVLTFLSLSGAYRLYERCVVPWTETVALSTPPPLSGQVDFKPPIFVETAEAHFADIPWTRDADVKWQRSEEMFLFAQTIERDQESGNKVLMSPLAVLWKDPKRPDAPPYRLIAETALVQFENQFFDSAVQLSGADPGRIVYAELAGKVHLDGPDGLAINGHRFIFSEEAAQLFSDAPVAFRYGPTPRDGTEIQGTSEQMTLRLEPTSESAYGKDMPRVGGITALMLRRNVRLTARFEAQGRQTVARITSAGPFEYDFIRRIATFESQVEVLRQTQHDGEKLEDSLASDWLGLEFVPSESEEAVIRRSDDPAADRRPFDGLRFKRMRANALHRKVVVRSQAHGVDATMQDLSYDAIDRIAVLLDDRQVTVERGGARFTCPAIKIEHGDGNELRRLECTGAGLLTYTDERLGPHPLEARWGRRLDVLPVENEPVHLVRLEHEAQFVMPGQMGIVANLLKLWLDLQSATDQQAQDDPLRKPLPLKRARAEGDVRFVSNDLIVRKANSVEAVIQPGQLHPDPESSVLPAGGRGDARPQESAQRPWMVWSDEIRIGIVHDPSLGKLDARHVEADGGVLIQYQPEKPASLAGMEIEGPLELAGVRLVADSAGGTDQVVTLYGDLNDRGELRHPASVSLGPIRIDEAASLSLKRQENRVEIPGTGRFRVPINRDLNGEPLDKPGLLEIRWQERMEFDGQTTQFFGTVQSAFHSQRERTSRLYCEELLVQLNSRISFTDPQSRPDELQLELIHAKHQVRLEAYEHEGARLIGVRIGEVAAFQVTHSTGDFQGLGRGWMDLWTYGDAVRFSPTDAPQANQPAERSQPQWRYTGVSFAGTITGNLHRSVAELRDQVELISAPVPQAKVKFKKEDLTQRTPQAANAVRLACDRLRMTQRAYDDLGQERKFAELYAYRVTNSTEIEGQFGRAVADELKFEERRGSFVLRGVGRDATLWLQRTPDDPPAPSSHRLIEFIPAKRSFTADGSTGFGGSL